MSWGGAGIGAAIGAILGGPLGAGIGAAIGHYATNSDDKIELECPHCAQSVEIKPEGNIWSCPYCQKSFVANLKSDEEADYYINLCSLGLVAKIAKIDGVVSKSEAKAISNFLDNFCKTPEERELAKEMYLLAKDDENSFEYYGELLYSLFSDNQEFREAIYATLFDIASADGGLESSEERALKELIDILDLDISIYNYLYNELVGNRLNIEEYYKILECPVDASDSEIKKAYHKKVMEFHPDRLASKDLPEAFIKFANEQLNRVREAYEIIMEDRAKR